MWTFTGFLGEILSGASAGMIVGLTCERVDGYFTREGGEEAGQGAERAGAPGRVVHEVDASVMSVHQRYQQQIRAHQQVSQSQVSD